MLQNAVNTNWAEENMKAPEVKRLSSFNDIISNSWILFRKQNGRMTDLIREPDIVQDGWYEIHPDLEGIVFNFWIANTNDVHGVAINYSGNSEKAPWSYQLTGKVFEDVTKAKSWLRTESARLSEQSKREALDSIAATQLSNQIKTEARGLN